MVSLYLLQKFLRTKPSSLAPYIYRVIGWSQTPIAATSYNRAPCRRLFLVLILNFVYITVHFEKLRAETDIMMDLK